MMKTAPHETLPSHDLYGDPGIKVELGEDKRAFASLIMPDVDNPLWRGAVELEARQFIAHDYVKNHEELQEGYKDYLPHTRMAVLYDAALDGTTSVFAAARIIFYDPGVGFKTIADSNFKKTCNDNDDFVEFSDRGKQCIERIGLSSVYEIGTIAAEPGYGSVVHGMAVGLALGGAGRGSRFGIASLDRHVYERLSVPLLGTDNVVSLGPARTYIGSETLPILLDAEGAMMHLRSVREHNISEAFATVVLKSGRRIQRTMNIINANRGALAGLEAARQWV